MQASAARPTASITRRRQERADRYVARVSYQVVGAQTANERSRGLGLGREVMRWLFTGKGMTYGLSIVAGGGCSLPGDAAELK